MTCEDCLHNEIVKALECCTAKPRALCKECPYFLGNGKCKLAALQRDALDLINRQQAEIERPKTYYDDMQDAIYSFREDHAKVKFFKNEIKAEAVKDFSTLLVSKAKSTKERFLLESLVESVMKEMGCNDESKT